MMFQFVITFIHTVYIFALYVLITSGTPFLLTWVNRDGDMDK